MPPIEEPTKTVSVESANSPETGSVTSIESTSGTSIELGSEPILETGTNYTGKERKKVTLEQGKTLRLLAEEHFGDRGFWVYIYLENMDKISNPNSVPSGTVLVLPDKTTYSFDAADPQSVAKAKVLGNEVLKRF